MAVPEPNQLQMEALKSLDESICAEDANAVQNAVSSAYRSGLHQCHVRPLITLLDSPWHHTHEDIAHTLQLLRSPEAIEALERTTHSHLEYLEYDSGYALKRKCTWALADIGTAEAREALERIAKNDDQQIAAYAKKRLDHWAQEIARKGTSANT